jgi:hypothetical protein
LWSGGLPWVGHDGLISIFPAEPAGVWEKALSGFVGRLVEPRRSGRAWLVKGTERRRGVGTSLLRAVEEAAETDLLRLIGVTLEPAAAAFAAANGYEKVSEVWLMGVDLPTELPPPAWPDDVLVRTFREEDAHGLKELLDRAYSEELHHVPLSFEDWRTFMLTDPSFDPEA